MLGVAEVVGLLAGPQHQGATRRDRCAVVGHGGAEGCDLDAFRRLHQASEVEDQTVDVQLFKGDVGDGASGLALASGAVVQRCVHMGAEVGVDVQPLGPPPFAIGQIILLAGKGGAHGLGAFEAGALVLDLGNHRGHPLAPVLGKLLEVAGIERASEVDELHRRAS
jgi:hypothetical protein